MGIWTYLVEDEHEGRELTLCFEGMRLDHQAASRVLAEVEAHPLNVDARLTALGYCRATKRNADAQVLWLIERMPEASIEHFWAISEDSLRVAKGLWKRAFEQNGSARVFENAARSTFETDAEFSEEAYSAGERAPDADSAWFCRKAAFYEVQTTLKPATGRALANRALNAVLRAIELEAKPGRRNRLLWTAREYARSMSDRSKMKLLRDADAAWKQGNETDLQRQLTVLGLVALARGDEKRARELLQESAQHIHPVTLPSLALARGLASVKALDAVVEFLGALSSVSELRREHDLIERWLSELANGVTPSLLLEGERGADSA